MDTITAELDKGSTLDPYILLLGILVILFGFLTMYETDFWSARSDLWGPIAGVGILIIISNFFIRLFRSKLLVELLTIKNGKVIINFPKLIQFSGWVNGQTIEVEQSDVKEVKVFKFNMYVSTAPYVVPGLYWVCVILQSNQIIECRLGEKKDIKQIISFVKHDLPHTELIIDENIKL
jgi:hypothetical protein